MVAPAVITGPLHTHGVRTPEEFLAKQKAHIDQLRVAAPAYAWREPWMVVGQAVARINGGRWIVDCACGNAPSFSPDWMLAACFECGATYTDVQVPPDREGIELLLLRRPEAPTRNWAQPETVGDLIAENLAHGVIS